MGNNNNNNNDKGFFSDKSRMLGTALILVLVSFFLIVYGVEDMNWLYWLGIILLFAGFILAPLSRYTASKAHKKEKKEEKGKKEGQEEEESKQGKASVEEGKEKGAGKREGE
jgi:multisubunit Na+/H+ antiporter MnhG subunit